VPLTARLLAALKAARHLKGPLVFSGAGGELLTAFQQDSALARACKRAGLRVIGWHTLRHTFCSHLAMIGASARAIQELAGHASLTTTQRYMHLSPNSTREAIDLLERSGPRVDRGAGQTSSATENADYLK
jgi:site-specific recombinase XerD